MTVDWARLFAFDTPWLEIVVRGSAVYLGLFLLLRVVSKRQSGAVSISDILVVVLLADAAQNAMAADYTSITDGLLLVGVVVFWSHALDWLGYRVPLMGRLVHPPPLLLVRDGAPIRENLRRELMTEDELLTQVREQGIERIADVKSARLEGDGRVSVIPKTTKELKN